MSTWYQVYAEVYVPSDFKGSGVELHAVVKDHLGVDVDVFPPNGAWRHFDGKADIKTHGDLEELHDACAKEIKALCPGAHLKTSWWYDERDPDEVFGSDPDSANEDDDEGGYECAECGADDHPPSECPHGGPEHPNPAGGEADAEDEGGSP